MPGTEARIIASSDRLTRLGRLARVSRLARLGRLARVHGASWLRRVALLAIFSTTITCGPPPRGTIGAVLLRQETSGRVYLQDVPEHLAAGRAGLRPGDEILLIEGQDVRRLSETDLARLLEGNVGESVNLTLSRGKEVLVIELKRSMAEPYRVR